MPTARRFRAAAWLPLLWTSAGVVGIAVAPEPVPVQLVAHAYLVAPAWIAGCGPYSMLVDTGTTVTQLSPRVAAALNLTASDRLILSSPAGERTAGRVHVTVRVGSATVDRVETVIAEPALARHVPSIDGIIGQNFLARFDYTVDYRARRLVLGGPVTPDPHARLALEVDEGRPVVRATIGDGRTPGGRALRLIVDSGASDIVLFADRASLALTSGIVFGGAADAMTNSGTSRVETGSIARLTIGPLTVADVRFAAVPAPGTIDGLLPARLLGRFTVSPARGQISVF